MKSLKFFEWSSKCNTNWLKKNYDIVVFFSFSEANCSQIMAMCVKFIIFKVQKFCKVCAKLEYSLVRKRNSANLWNHHDGWMLSTPVDFSTFERIERSALVIHEVQIYENQFLWIFARICIYVASFYFNFWNFNFCKNQSGLNDFCWSFVLFLKNLRSDLRFCRKSWTVLLVNPNKFVWEFDRCRIDRWIARARNKLDAELGRTENYHV